MTRKRLFNAAAITAALTLITACMLGGTFAKYTTSAGGSGSARVARFGVQISAPTNGFSNSYLKHSSLSLPPALSQTIVSVQRVVAPGTNGTFAASTLSGSTEVAVEVRRTATMTLSGWEYEYEEDEETVTEFYCPIVIRMGDESVAGLSCESVEEFEAAVKDMIEDADYIRYYPAGQPLANITNPLPNITWEWAFDPNGGANDVKDTYLGYQAANDNASTIAMEITTTVTQID
ncbi:MAG: hypothetical protein IJL78_10305 [Lachnospiraceae bacterium]|nr:hypothetical protein [Lachnospiraceae bacterium]